MLTKMSYMLIKCFLILRFVLFKIEIMFEWSFEAYFDNSAEYRYRDYHILTHV